MDTGCVELLLRNGRKISIDCTGVEDALNVTMAQKSELDYLIYNDPLGYACDRAITIRMIEELPGIQHPALCPIVPARPVWYRVQTGAACPASGRVCRALCGPPWFWRGLLCCLRCAAVCPGALWLVTPPAGYTATAQPRPVSPVTTEKIKKAQKNYHTPYCQSQKFPAKIKRPLQRV